MLLKIIEVPYIIKMRYPLDELIDKQSIIQLKIERIPGENIALKQEFKDYTNAVMEYVSEGACTKQETSKWHQELYLANGKTWDLEAAIRQGKEGELGLEEVGKRAIAIRENNGKRIRIKSDIVEKTGLGYKDIKINHASA